MEWKRPFAVWYENVARWRVMSVSEKDIEMACEFMERYSPFDYIDSMTYDTKEEYERMLTILEENGSTINRKDA